MDGQLEFWDTSDMTLMNNQDHSMATDLEWDPTGRYAVTSVSYWSQKVCWQAFRTTTCTQYVQCFSKKSALQRLF